MSICSGKTKTGINCTKKIKGSDTLCHLHKDQAIQPEIINDHVKEKPQQIIDIPKSMKSTKIIMPKAKLKILTEQEVINLEKLRIERAKILNVWTFNINSIRNKMDLVDKLLIKHDIDILFLTETKIQPKLEAELNFHPDYICFWNNNKNSYHHGTCFIYRKTLQIELLSDFLPTYEHELDVKNKITKNVDVIEQYRSTMDENVIKGHNSEGRILTIKCTFNEKEIVIVGTYVPNSGSDKKQPLKRLGYRIERWDKSMFYYLLELDKKYKNIIWLGDLNVIVKDNDVLNIKANIAGVTPEEIESIRAFLNKNLWIDTWDYSNPNIVKCKARATWGVNSKFPLRLDYVICSPSLKDNIVSSFNDQYFDGSDHIPIGAKFSIENPIIL